MRYLHTGLILVALVLTLSDAVAGPTDLDSIRRMAASGEQMAAIARLDDIIAEDDNDLQARFLKGSLLLESGDRDGARDTFAEIARLFPRLPESFNNLAAIYAEEGEYEKSRQALLSAAANAPDYAAVRSNLGDLYVKMALDSYHKALELNPADEVSRERLQHIKQLFLIDG